MYKCTTNAVALSVAPMAQHKSRDLRNNKTLQSPCVDCGKYHYLLSVSYEGARFCGWQKQPQDPHHSYQRNAEYKSPTAAQNILDWALNDLFHHHKYIKNQKSSIITYGAGRTDAQVHALHQGVTFAVERYMHPQILRDALNARLRIHPIRIMKCWLVSHYAHARFSALERIYQYRILNKPIGGVHNTFDQQRAWCLPFVADGLLMQEAAKLFEGTHDFNTFRSAHCQSPSSIRTIHQCVVTPDLCHKSAVDQHADYLKPQGFTITVRAPSFLHNQVRIMVGGIVQVGRNTSFSVHDLKKALEACDRTKGPTTAPAHGLYFCDVLYPTSFFL